MASDLVCTEALGCGISPLALTEKGVVSRCGDAGWGLAKTLSGRRVTDLQQFHSSTIPFGEAICTCAVAALSVPYNYFINRHPPASTSHPSYISSSAPLIATEKQAIIAFLPIYIYIYISAREEEHLGKPLDIFSNLFLSTKCSLRNDDSAVLCSIPDFRSETLANPVSAETAWIVNLRRSC